MAVSVLGTSDGRAVGTCTGTFRPYDGGCPTGTGSKRDLTHGTGAQGAHGVTSLTNRTVWSARWRRIRPHTGRALLHSALGLFKSRSVFSLATPIECRHL
ncbi:hypothetical protein GCM10010498_26180 [Streptomyces cavourensis]|nr:hypothetical protein GCM10010498_26180 [Streptomyces cavourensis]